jgi:hypothetical protein
MKTSLDYTSLATRQTLSPFSRVGIIALTG